MIRAVSDHEQLLRRAYAAFNARDLDAVLVLLHPEVDWSNAWEGGRVHGRHGVRDYWTRQWAELDPRVEPEAFEADGEELVAVVAQHVRDAASGELVRAGTVRHRYAFRDGLVARMDVEA